jgi:predicted transcriptional regulator
MPDIPPTERELEILKILWDHGEASVREVYEQMSRSAPIVQNTVQAFLRTMEDKGLVRHRVEGRTFIYRPVPQKDQTQKNLVGGVLDRVFDGAIDQLVQSALSLRKPTREELDKLEELIRRHKVRKG